MIDLEFGSEEEGGGEMTGKGGEGLLMTRAGFILPSLQKRSTKSGLKQSLFFSSPRTIQSFLS